MTSADRAAVVIAREVMNRDLTWLDLHRLLPAVTDPTISKAIQTLMRTGVIVRKARAPRVLYTWTGADIPEELAQASEEIDRGARVSPRLTHSERRAIEAQRDKPAEVLAVEHGITVGTVMRIWRDAE